MNVKELKQQRLVEVEISIDVLTRFIRDYGTELSELKKERKRLKDHIKRLETEPEKTQYILIVETDEFNVDDRWIEEVVEHLRAYAFPTVWGLQGMGPGKPPVFRAEFEITADERSGCEYLEDVRNELMYSGIGNSNSKIQAVGR